MKPDVSDWLNLIPEPLKSLLAYMFIIYLLLRLLVKTFKVAENISEYIKLKFYYPIIIKLNKRKHKDYVRTYLRTITREEPLPGWGFKYDIDIEWSNEDSVNLDLEHGVLLIRTPYIENVRRILAKALLMISPYMVSDYLEPLFGESLARVLAYSIAREYASRDPSILKEFIQYVKEAYGDDQYFMSLINYINEAEETSHYKHIVLRELKYIFEIYNGNINRNVLENEIYQLIELVAKLSEAEKPMICGEYVLVTIVRAGKLEKILLEEWERYVRYIKKCLNECRNLHHIYVVSAGERITREVAEKLINYIQEGIKDIKLIDEFFYRMRRYKGRTRIRGFTAVFELT